MGSRESLSLVICGVIAAVLVGLLLFGGGGGGPRSATPSGGDARPEIEAMLNRVFTQNDPAQCTEDVTPAFLRQSFGGAGNPLERCHRLNTTDHDTTGHRIAPESVTVHGPRAQAVVRVSGGTSDGSVLTVALVQDGTRWKIDRLTHLEIDRARFDAALAQKVRSEGMSAREANCVVSAVRRRYDTAALERMELGGSDDMEAVRPTIVSCLSNASLAQRFRQQLVEGMSGHGIPARGVDCIADTVVDGLGTRRLRTLSSAGAAATDEIRARVRSAAISCRDAYRRGDLGGVS